MVKFSIIIAVYNTEKYLNECLDSLINQTFKDMEVICINDGSTDNSLSILEDYANKDNRIKVYSKDHKGPGAARNYGLEIAQGEYINFLDSDDKLTHDALESVNSFIDKNKDIDLISIPICLFNEKNYKLNYKFDKKNDSKDRVIDLIENPEALQASASSCFIKKEAIRDIRFDENLLIDEDLVFINKVLLFKKKIGLVKKPTYYFRRSNENSLSNTSKTRKEFYNYRLKCLRELISYSIENEGKVPDFIQGIIVYALRKFENVDDLPEFLSKEEKQEFWEILYDILDHIDEEIILNPRIISNKKIYFSRFLIYLKNRKEFSVEIDEEKNILLKTKDTIINNLQKHKIFLDIIELKDGFLNLSGNYVSSCYNEAIRIEAIKVENGKKEVFKAKYMEYPRTTRVTKRFLGIDWRFNYNFDIKIPIEKDKETRIDFRTIYEEDNNKVVIKSKIGFRKFAELSKFSHFYIRDSQILAHINKSIYIMPYKYTKALRLEISSFKKILRSSQKFKFKSIFYRLLYLLYLPKMKNKQIYLFMDRRDSTGDNGEHLFRYATGQNDNVEKYFALEKENPEFEKLKKEFGNRILAFGSLKHKKTYMFTKKFISSQGYKRHINPFADENLKLVQGISSPPIYFLQHGVVKYNRINWLRKFDFNFSLLLTVSDLDYNAFVENYNYDSQIIQKLGFPRYDELNNDNLKKEIFIMPTWRQAIKTEDDLLSSEYFTRWNSLLNNMELIDFAKEKGYKIIFKPHHNSLKFLDLFNTDNIEIDNDRRIHELLCETSLMVTDYSSVHFDFAYLKKPIVYYHYGEESVEIPELGEALVDDEASTFGDVFKEEEELVNKIKEYIENDCKMEEKYNNRVNNFFKYTDKNNCKRVYDWIRKH